MFSRFLKTERKCFSLFQTDPTKRVKPHAFTPMFNKTRQRKETSVADMAGKTEAQVWNHGRTHVHPKIKGRADFVRQDAEALEPVALEHDPPPAEHYNILGWEPNTKAGKGRDKVVCQKLAEIATLRLPGESVVALVLGQVALAGSQHYATRLNELLPTLASQFTLNKPITATWNGNSVTLVLPSGVTWSAESQGGNWRASSQDPIADLANLCGQE